jgi:hypothetical protein
MIHRNRKINLKIHVEAQKTQKEQSIILSKRSNAGGIPHQNSKFAADP